MHKWITDEKGRCKVENARPIYQTVEAVYVGGKIRTSSGDVWDIEHNPSRKESDFITIVPKAQHKAA